MAKQGGESLPKPGSWPHQLLNCHLCCSAGSTGRHLSGVRKLAASHFSKPLALILHLTYQLWEPCHHSALLPAHPLSPQLFQFKPEECRGWRREGFLSSRSPPGAPKRAPTAEEWPSPPTPHQLIGGGEIFLGSVPTGLPDNLAFGGREENQRAV